MEHQPFVYGLFDPADAGHIRYVGMAPSNPSRPHQHAKRARKDLADDSHLMHWIRKIQAEGREPSVMILEQLREKTGRAFLGFVESCYIKSLREIGHSLTNENDGGWGGSNGPHTPEAVARMKAGWTSEIRARVGKASRERLLGKPRPLASRKKQSLTRMGRRLSDENRFAIGASRKAAWDKATLEEKERHSVAVSQAMKSIPGHVQTEETRVRISMALTGRVMSEEWRAKNAAAQRGKKASPETRAKQSTSQKAAWARRKSVVRQAPKGV
jgi:hypothetical protein